MEARAQTIVAERYALHERVGQGGCGVVYRATDQTTGDTVAIKMLSRAARQDPSFVERLVREQQALLALAGTHAVAAIDLCRADTGELCLVMEWLEGADLEQHLSTQEQLGTRFAVEELLQVMRPVLETLAKAHELGIVHRDVKPANIFLLSEDRGVRLLDFGFSRLKTSATLTAADTVMGSPSYIAPEAWLEGSKAIGKQADLYAAGVIVFRALAGRVPFDGASLVETMQLVTTAQRPRLSELRPDLPKVMDDWFECALSVAPERRFQDAQSFLEALSAALAGMDLPGHTLPSGAAHALPPPPKTTPGERQNALSTALGRAASLLKRVASSFSRAPTPASPPTPGAPSPEPPRPELADGPGLAPPPRNTPSRVRTKPALPPLVRPRGSSDALPTVNAVGTADATAHIDRAQPPSEVHSPPLPESDRLIAELLPPSLPPPAPAVEAEAPSARSSKQTPKPRTRRPAKKGSSAKATPSQPAHANTAGTRAKARKSTGKATTAATKKAATATKTAPKPAAAKKATPRKQKATKKQTRAVATTPRQPTQEQAAEQSPALTSAAGGAEPTPSASMHPPAERRPSRSGQRPRAAKRSPKRTRGKADNPQNGTVDKVDKKSLDKD